MKKHPLQIVTQGTYGVRFVVFLASFLLGVGMFVPAYASTLELNPPTGSYVVGSEVPIDVFVDSDGKSINAISGEIRYRPDMLRAVSVSRENSIIDLWLEEPSVKQSGDGVVFEGLLLNPGFTGQGKVITIRFKVLGPGVSAITFASGLVLANDGFGTNILKQLEGASLTLLSAAPGISATPVTPLPEAENRFLSDGEELLAPVVISYTSNPPTLDDLSIRGVTYPNTDVNVFLSAVDSKEVSEYQTTSDAGGNFLYEQRRAVQASRLLSANVFSILAPLSQGKKYQFWLTAVRDNIETDPTQPFGVVVGGQGGALSTIVVFLIALLALLVVILVAFLLVRYYIVQPQPLRPHPGAPYRASPKERLVLKDIKKDVDNLAYDVEKHMAKDRQDARIEEKGSHTPDG